MGQPINATSEWIPQKVADPFTSPSTFHAEALAGKHDPPGIAVPAWRVSLISYDLSSAPSTRNGLSGKNNRGASGLRDGFESTLLILFD